MALFRAVAGQMPFFVDQGETPGSYTTNDRFAVAHSCSDFAGKPKVPDIVEVIGTAPDQYESQTLTITGSPTGGTFTLTFAGETTDDIDYNASAADVEAALEALDSIGEGNVSCAGGALPGTPVVISFAGGELAGTFPELMTVDDGDLSGGENPAAAVAVTHTFTHHEIAIVGKDETHVYLRASGECTFELHTA